ncbi:hypothetical protein [Calothrix sp. NIES-2100]|uniref:hypothetical protein n=1 Tax=Calothrix sp. NIES-2100 TaxID=1954172 RepID=UPI000BBC0A77
MGNLVKKSIELSSDRDLLVSKRSHPQTWFTQKSDRPDSGKCKIKQERSHKSKKIKFFCKSLIEDSD